MLARPNCCSKHLFFIWHFRAEIRYYYYFRSSILLQPIYLILHSQIHGLSFSIIYFVISQTVLLVQIFLFPLLSQPNNICVPILHLRKLQLFRYLIYIVFTYRTIAIIYSIYLQAYPRRTYFRFFSFPLQNHPHTLFLFYQHVPI